MPTASGQRLKEILPFKSLQITSHTSYLITVIHTPAASAMMAINMQGQCNFGQDARPFIVTDTSCNHISIYLLDAFHAPHIATRLELQEVSGMRGIQGVGHACDGLTLAQLHEKARCMSSSLHISCTLHSIRQFRRDRSQVLLLAKLAPLRHCV